MISQLLKSFRIQNGYTQQHIADFLGVERSTYSYYETGKTRPSTDILAKLSFLYHVALEDFIPASYKKDPVLELNCAIPEGVSLYDNTEVFSNLTFEEQQLVMNFRACADKRKFIDTIKEFVAEENKIDDISD